LLLSVHLLLQFTGKNKLSTTCTHPKNNKHENDIGGEEEEEEGGRRL
jgi:hypothetical protein